jgi:hypothetical protein
MGVEEQGKAGAIVVLVFESNTGRVSVNGKPWVSFRLSLRPSKPETQEGSQGESKSDPYTTPPGKDDDTLKCMKERGTTNCRWHQWDGTQWVSLGSQFPCPAPCPPPP